MPNQDFRLNTGLQVSGAVGVSGSVSASGGFTGSLFGTASRSDLLDGYDSSEFAFTGSTNYFKASQIVSGNLNVTASLTASSLTGTDLNIDYIDFVPLSPESAPAHQTGRAYVSTDTYEINYCGDVPNTPIILGQQLVVKAKCVDMATFTIGQVVRINGGNSGFATFVTASWDNDSTSADTIGVLMNSGGNNGWAYILLSGYLKGVDTSTYTEGQTIYLSSSGQITNIPPAPPYHEVRLGEVITTSNNGSIFVRVQNGYEIGELHDVYTSSLNNGDLLVYESSPYAQWTNKKILSGSYQLTGGLNTLGFLSASAITGAFSGSGALINNITASNITNFTSDVRKQYSITSNFDSILFSYGVIDLSSDIVAPGSLKVQGPLIASGSVTLGDATTDTITLNAATMSLGNGTGVLNIDSNTLYVDGNAGRVGIQTTSPQTLLDINSTSDDATIRLYHGYAGNDVRISSPYGAGGKIGTWSNHLLTFVTNNTERMRITGDGKVNIGGANSPGTSVLMELTGTNVGLLFPRVSGSARATMTGTTGLIVYQTDTSGSDAEGLYIYKSSGWIQII